MISVGVVGLGYWGPNLVRNFVNDPKANLLCVCDLDENQLKKIKLMYPSLNTTQEFTDLIENPYIDAIAIATPVDTHFELALQALKAGKNVWVEKPLAATSEQGEILIEQAKQKKLVIMVDHTWVYTPAVKKIRELTKNGCIGDISYYDSVRINLGLFQNDVDVLWDLAVHDLSIIDFIIPHKPIAVSSTGLSHVPNAPANIASMTLMYDEPCLAHIYVNWLSPTKVRCIHIGGSNQMIVYDDMEPDEKIKIYDKGIEYNYDKEQSDKLRINYRIGDMFAPNLERTEALNTAISHFIDCIDKNIEPITNAVIGLKIVKILEKASISMANNGAPEKL